jgi:DtxR family Mn-dependent transcriptional regulator
MNDSPTVTPAMEDYLKGIYELGGALGTVSTQQVAGRLSVSCPSATNMIKKLAALELLMHTPYRGVELTAQGTLIARRVLRHHELLELFLWRTLAIPPDQGHREAERLEHYLSAELESRLSTMLGLPEHPA